MCSCCPPPRSPHFGIDHDTGCRPAPRARAESQSVPVEDGHQLAPALQFHPQCADVRGELTHGVQRPVAVAGAPQQQGHALIDTSPVGSFTCSTNRRYTASASAGRVVRERSASCCHCRSPASLGASRQAADFVGSGAPAEVSQYQGVTRHHHHPLGASHGTPRCPRGSFAYAPFESRPGHWRRITVFAPHPVESGRGPGL